MRNAESARAKSATTQDLVLSEWQGQLSTNRLEIDYNQTIELAAVGVATVFALLIVLVALALAAADGRDDERLFAAIGSPPALLRRKRTIEAAVLTFGAGLLGACIGLIPTLAVLWSNRPPDYEVASFPSTPSDFYNLPAGYYDLQVPVVELIALVVGVTAFVTAVVWVIQAVGGLRPRRDLILTDA